MLQPVCTTEIGRLALKYDELVRKGVKLATLSCDRVSFLSLPSSHLSPSDCRLNGSRRSYWVTDCHTDGGRTMRRWTITTGGSTM